MILPAFLGAVNKPSAAASSLLTGLVSYWKLDEASGTRYDSHGSNHLTDNNTVGQGAGKLGNAADFEASSSQYLSHAGFAWPTAWTLSLWVKVESFADSYMALFSRDGGVPRRISTIFVKSNGKLAVYIDSTNYDGSGAVTLTTSTWYHIVWSYSAATGIQVWVNGTVDVDTADSITPGTESLPVNIGRDLYNSSRFFDGLIDAVGLWSRVLTSDERNALYGSGSGLEYPFPFFLPTDISGLALWLDASDASTLFQNSNGTTAATADGDPVGYWGDKSGNARHATQATSSARPTLKTAVVNGKNAVLPDATDDYLALASALSLGTGAYTLYAVGTRANATILFPLVANNLPICIFFDNNVYYTSDSGSLSLAYTGSTGAIALRVRRTAGGAVTFAATGQADASMGTLGGAMAVQHVGGRPSQGQWQDGTNKLCEILVYTAEVTGTNDSNILSYLSAKWGTSIP